MKFTWSYQEKENNKENNNIQKYSEEWYAQERKRLKALFYEKTHIKPGTKLTENDIQKYWDEFEVIGIYQGVTREGLREALLED